MSGKGKDSAAARILGSGTSGQYTFSFSRHVQRVLTLRVLCIGIAELMIFHPVDTVAKRLMSNKTKVRVNFLNPSLPILTRLFSSLHLRMYRSHSTLSPLSSSETTPPLPFPGSCSLSSLA